MKYDNLSRSTVSHSGGVRYTQSQLKMGHVRRSGISSVRRTKMIAAVCPRLFVEHELTQQEECGALSGNLVVPFLSSARS